MIKCEKTVVEVSWNRDCPGDSSYGGRLVPVQSSAREESLPKNGSSDK